MDLALVLLVLWALLFLPIGLAVHGLVLGAAARVRALPLAPITGIAAALLTLSLLARLGIDAGDTWVAWAFVAAAIVCAVAVWRWKLPWRSRELIGSSLLLLLAVLLVQLPVVGAAGDGPLGYGTVADPVEEVASIDAAVGGDAADREVARNARSAADDRPVGFEQFAALTVAFGSAEGDDTDASWTAYSLHAPITGMLAALVALPLFAFARARGVRWFGLVFLVPVGVLAPYTFLGLANGTGAAIATVPLLAAAVFSLLVTKRDRGWWSLAMLFGSAIAVTGGALAVLPLLTIGISWMLLRATTYEHLAQGDVPLGQVRALGPGVVAAVAAVVGVATTLRSGELLAWPRLHDTVLAAAKSWPFAWLDTDLSTAGPSSGVETAIWLAGPALLVIAAIHGIIRNERRELAVLFGAVAAAGIGLVASTIERDAGIRLYEYSILVVSPLLAALAVRGVALARENAEASVSRSRIARAAGWGPVVLAVGFVVLSLASTSVIGSRMVHAPALTTARIEPGATIVAGGDPWLAFIVDGERVPGGYADADALASRTTKAGEQPLSAWDTLVLASTPLGSDPAPRFGEDSALDSYQARLFYDRLVHPGAGSAGNMRGELAFQQNYTAVAERNDAKRTGGTDAEQAEADRDRVESEDPPAPTPIRHTPVEPANSRVTPDRPAGLLLPETDVEGCGVGEASQVETGRCDPDEPVVGTDCTDEDVRAAASPLATGGAKQTRDAERPGRVPAGSGVLLVASDPNVGRLPKLLGVQCFDVEVEADARVLMVHLRNIGLILAPDVARTSPRQAWETTTPSGAAGVEGGVRHRTDRANASVSYGGGRVSGPGFDVVAEGSFGAGVALESGFGATALGAAEIDGQPMDEELATLRGATNGFSAVARDVALQGSIVLRNTSGTDVEFGRVFARPRDIPPSCDVPIGIATGEQRELRIESVDSATNDPVQRPGLTVTVVEARGEGRSRTARIVVGSYLAYAGLPRYVLVDWTQQFGSKVTTRGCDGEIRTEAGTAPPGGGSLALEAGDDIVEGLGAAAP